MSKKLPYSGSAAKKGRNFYSSGISQLMNRIDKLEHQVFCCGDDTDEVVVIDGAAGVAGENQDGAFFLFDRADGVEFTLPEATAANIGWNATVNINNVAHSRKLRKISRTCFYEKSKHNTDNSSGTNL